MRLDRLRIDAAVARGGHGQEVEIIAVTKTHGVDAVRAATRPGQTKLVWLEAPGSVTMEFGPVAHLAHICRSRGITTALDKARPIASPETLAEMEEALLDTATETDPGDEWSVSGSPSLVHLACRPSYAR